MREIFLLLGSNCGDRLELIEQAKSMITEKCGPVTLTSSLYETEPWGFEDKTLFLNQVVELETGLKPEELMEQLLTIETRLGRIRPFESCGFPSLPADKQHPYTSRTIDIDILFYGSKMIFTGNLMIPHPRLHERRFALEPLNEIAPGFIHPILKKSIKMLLENCTDHHSVKTHRGASLM